MTKKTNICRDCGDHFLPWRDEYGDEIFDICYICDLSRLDGMLEDREREA